MITHSEQQGTSAWKKLRSEYFTASTAAAMMGVSKHMSRDDLLMLKKTGIEKEHNEHMLKLFAKGHEAEASIRPVIEKLIGEELYPVVGSIEVDGLKLLASFDGLTMMENTGLEVKLWNEKLAEQVRAKKLEPHSYWQLEQQIMVSGDCEKIIFVVTDGTEEKMEWMEYTPVRGRANKLIKGWQQFESDLDAYEVQPEVVAPVGKSLEPLPILSVIAVGEIKNSNLPAYKSAVSTYINEINETLETDDQFADAEQAVKGLQKGEKEAKGMIQSILSQTATIKEVIDTVEYLAGEMRSKRLTLDKLVKAEKANRRAEIIGSAEQDLSSHIEALNNSVSPYSVGVHDADFASAVKGLKTIMSMQNAVNTEVARIKVMINEHAELIQANDKAYKDSVGEYGFLFSDINDLIHSGADYFGLLIDKRISDHKAEEKRKAKAEEERIRTEEQAKAKREAETKAEAERQRIRDEEIEKLRIEQEERVQVEDQSEDSGSVYEAPDMGEAITSTGPAPQAKFKEPTPPMAAASNQPATFAPPEGIRHDVTPTEFNDWWEQHGKVMAGSKMPIRHVASVAWEEAIKWYQKNVSEAA